MTPDEEAIQSIVGESKWRTTRNSGMLFTFPGGVIESFRVVHDGHTDIAYVPPSRGHARSEQVAAFIAGSPAALMAAARLCDAVVQQDASWCGSPCLAELAIDCMREIKMAAGLLGPKR